MKAVFSDSCVALGAAGVEEEVMSAPRKRVKPQDTHMRHYNFMPIRGCSYCNPLQSPRMSSLESIQRLYGACHGAHPFGITNNNTKTRTNKNTIKVTFPKTTTNRNAFSSDRRGVINKNEAL